MPSVDPPYVIGVIREKEKGLLSADEYTRIVGAPTPEEAVHVLNDTPYGIAFEQSGSAFEALSIHLRQELDWLQELIKDKDVVTFITARYDGLAITSALFDVRDGKDTLSMPVALASISPQLLERIMWHNEGIEDAPVRWQEYIRSESERVRQDDWTKTDALTRAEAQVKDVMKQAARTPMMKSIAALVSERLALDLAVRVQQVIPEQLPDFLEKESATAVADQVSATAYEKAWDERLLTLVRDRRNEPIGYDPIVGYWYAKEIEAKTLRLLLFAKLGGMSTSQMAPLIRSRYQQII